MRNASALLLSLLVALLLAGCGGSSERILDGGPCEYFETDGTATITSVRDSDPGEYNCDEAVTVLFTFTPDDPGAVDRYLFPGVPDDERHFTVGAGMNPNGEWALGKELTVGSEHRCIRREITDGTCTPVLFEFSELELAGWEEGCWGE